MENNDCLIIIPSGSTSIYQQYKLLYRLFNQTIIEETWENTKKSNIGIVVVMTPFKQIGKYIEEHNGNVLYTDDYDNYLQQVSENINRIDPGRSYSKIIINYGSVPYFDFEHINTLKNLLNYNPISGISNCLLFENRKKDDSIIKTFYEFVDNEHIDIPFVTRSKAPYPKTEFIKHYKLVEGLYGFRRRTIESYKLLKKTRLERVEDINLLRFLINNYRILARLTNENIVRVKEYSDINFIRAQKENLG